MGIRFIAYKAYLKNFLQFMIVYHNISYVFLTNYFLLGRSGSRTKDGVFFPNLVKKLEYWTFGLYYNSFAIYKPNKSYQKDGQRNVDFGQILCACLLL